MGKLIVGLIGWGIAIPVALGGVAYGMGDAVVAAIVGTVLIGLYRAWRIGRRTGSPQRVPR